MLKEVSFKLIHKGVCVGRGHFRAHGCAMDLLKDFVAEGEYIFLSTKSNSPFMCGLGRGRELLSFIAERQASVPSS